MDPKFERNWKRPTINKFAGFLLLVVGLITLIAGFGAWKNPHLDWEVFKASFASILATMGEELVRYLHDPFAFVGLIMMLAGTIATIKGIRTLLSKQDMEF